MTSKVKFDITFEISDLKYPSNHAHVASNFPSGSHWGLCSLLMASEVKFNLGSKFGNLNKPGIHVHVACNSLFSGLWGHLSLQMASEATSGLIFELTDLNNLCCHVFLASKCFQELNETEEKCLPETSVASAHAGKKISYMWPLQEYFTVGEVVGLALRAMWIALE